MLSRDAEHLYWLARYIERAENTARMINVNVEMMLDFPVDETLGWESIIESMDSKKDFLKIYSNYDESNVIYFLRYGDKFCSHILQVGLSQKFG